MEKFIMNVSKILHDVLEEIIANDCHTPKNLRHLQEDLKKLIED